MTHSQRQAVISFDKGVQRMKGEESLLKKLCSVFIRTYEAQLKELEQAIEAGDVQSAHKIAHSIKGGAGTIEAVGVLETAQAMETAARAGDLPGVRELYPSLADVSNQTRQAILARYPDLDS